MKSIVFSFLATLISVEAISLNRPQLDRREEISASNEGPLLDLVTDLIGRYKYVPENSSSCPSAYALIVNKEKEYIRSFCENGRKLYTFGKMESLNEDFVVEYPTPLDSEGEFKKKVEFLDLGFKYNEDSSLNDCEADKIPEDKFMDLVGDFEESRDGKNCKKYRYVSFYGDGAYTIIGCPKTKNGKPIPGKVEEGIYAINNITNTEVSLDFQPPLGYKYRGAVKQSEKDKLNFKGIDLIRCLTKKPGSNVATDDIDDFDYDEPTAPTTPEKKDDSKAKPSDKDKAPLIDVDFGIGNKPVPEKKGTLLDVDLGIAQKDTDKPTQKDNSEAKEKAPLIDVDLGVGNKPTPEKKATLLDVDLGIAQKDADKPTQKDNSESKGPLIDVDLGVGNKPTPEKKATLLDVDLGIAQKDTDKPTQKDNSEAKDKAPLIDVDLGVGNKPTPEKKATLLDVDLGIGQKSADEPNGEMAASKDKPSLIGIDLGIGNKDGKKPKGSLVNLDLGLAQAPSSKPNAGNPALIDLNLKALGSKVKKVTTVPKP